MMMTVVLLVVPVVVGTFAPTTSLGLFPHDSEPVFAIVLVMVMTAPATMEAREAMVVVCTFVQAVSDIFSWELGLVGLCSEKENFFRSSTRCRGIPQHSCPAGFV